MKEDLIRRGDAIKAIDDLPNCYNGWSDAYDKAHIIQTLEDIPAVEPKICDTCRYYNSYIPCGSTPSACMEADKFAEEFVDGLKKLKPKDEPQSGKE